MKKLKKIILILILVTSITICNLNMIVQAVTTVESSDPEYSYNDMRQARIPNIVLVYPKKVNNNSVRIFFQNIGIDNVDWVSATLVLIDQFGHPIYHEYVARNLSPLFNQSWEYYSPNWKTAQVTNVKCIDGKDKDMPLKNSDIIYNN